jgi:gliding motility-associated-like protein
MFRFAWILGFQLLALGGLYGQCTIVANHEVCKDDLVPFSMTVSSGTPVSYDWDFGSFGTSSNATPLMKFTSATTIVVSCTATLSSGQKCSDTSLLIILPLPKSAFGIGSESLYCLHENKVCLNDSSEKAAKGIQKISFVWGDGNLSQFTQPLAKKWCHVYADTGWHSVYMEVEDSAGCKGTFTKDLHIHASIKHDLRYSAVQTCDSIKLCLFNLVQGGSNINNNWYTLPGNQKVTITPPWCKMLQPKELLKFKLVSDNEFGCADSVVFEYQVAASTFYLQKLMDTICSSDLPKGLPAFKSGEEVEWYLNGTVEGRDSVYKANPLSRVGRNYVGIKRVLNGCTGWLLDSFEVPGVPSSAWGYNDNRTKVEDTAFFLDRTRGVPGGRYSRLWDFGDEKAEPCTTSTAKGINVGKNCNFSTDSIARHFYPDTLCYRAKLSIYDSSTRCSDDSLILVFRHEMCPPFFIPPKVCEGQFANFTMPLGMERKVGDSNFLIPDINFPQDTIKMYHGHAAYMYKSPGLKSPVIWRYYSPDTVWTEQGGKIVVKFIRPGLGWVADTFFHKVEVEPQSKADFALTKVSVCDSFKVRLDFNHTKWLYPDTMYVYWERFGIPQKFYGFKDTFYNLVPLEHTYPKGGKYEITVRLLPYKGCEGSFYQEARFSHVTFLRTALNCPTEKVCFVDSVLQLGVDLPVPFNRWTGNGKYGELYWDFGDGTKDTGYSMCHVFPGIGDYVVTLTARSKEGCNVWARDTIRLTGPKAGIKVPPPIYCNETKQYFDSSFMILPNNGQVINQWSWNFGDGTVPAPVKNPVHIFPGGGYYTVRLRVKTQLGCTDSTTAVFHVIGPEVSARIVSDSAGCAPLRVEFANYSRQTKNFIWQFGDPKSTNYSTTKDTNTSFVYTRAGDYYAHIIGGDSFFNPVTGSKYYCTVKYPAPGSSAMKIKVFDAAKATFNIPEIICVQDSFALENFSFNDSVKYRWKFGNGDSTLRDRDTFYYKYADTGTYKVKLYAEVTNPENIKCFDTTERTIRVIILQPNFKQDCNSLTGSDFTLENTSGLQVDGYRWTELDPSDSSEKFLSDQYHLSYNFGNETGLKWICLGLSNSKACGGKICKQVFVSGGILLANVFTPGKDGFNDSYRIPVGAYEVFDLVIFNRWGEKVFATKDPKIEWNGQVNNTGSELPSGTYFYRLLYTSSCNAEPKTISGSINLIR